MESIRRTFLKHSRWISRSVACILLLDATIAPAIAQNENDVAREIMAAGGVVTKDGMGRVRDLDLYFVPDASIEQLNFETLIGLKSLHLGSRAATDRSLARLNGIPAGLERISVTSAQITDDALVDFLKKHRKSINYAAFTGTAISGKSLVELGQHKELWHLGLSKTKVTDKGLAELTGLLKLYSLSLRDTDVSDNGLKAIAKYPRLESLFLDGTKVTDGGLPELASLKKLKLLGVNSTSVTEQGKAALKALLPNLAFSKQFKMPKK